MTRIWRALLQGPPDRRDSPPHQVEHAPPHCEADDPPRDHGSTAQPGSGFEIRFSHSAIAFMARQVEIIVHRHTPHSSTGITDLLARLRERTDVDPFPIAVDLVVHAVSPKKKKPGDSVPPGLEYETPLTPQINVPASAVAPGSASGFFVDFFVAVFVFLAAGSFALGAAGFVSTGTCFSRPICRAIHRT